MLTFRWKNFPIICDRKPSSLRIFSAKNNSYISTYLSTFFTFPVKRQSGENLSHEEVINKLDNETVSYEVALGISDLFTECLRISIKVETSFYETAVEWIKDLVYGTVFTEAR